MNDQMDPILERILSLIPKKENGEYVYGAKKKFCDSIGISAQNLSDWIAGRSAKYMDKLYEISNVYGVSVAWLKTGNRDSETLDSNGKELTEEQEALQIMRDNPKTRTLLFAGKHLSADQIDNFARIMESISEG